MDIDYILQASHMTLLTWPTPVNPTTPSTPMNPSSPPTSHTLTYLPTPAPPKSTYLPPIYTTITDDHSTTTPTSSNTTYLPPIYSMVTDDHHTTHEVTLHTSPNTSDSDTHSLVGPESDISQILNLLDNPDPNPTPETADAPNTDHTAENLLHIITPTRVCVTAHSPSNPIHAHLSSHNHTHDHTTISTSDTYPNDPILAMPVTTHTTTSCTHIPHACNVPNSLNESKTILYQAISHLTVTPEIMDTIDNIHTLSDTQLTQQFITGKKRKAPTRRLNYDMDPHTLHLTTAHGHTSKRWTKTYQRTPEARDLCISQFDTDTPIT